MKKQLALGISLVFALAACLPTGDATLPSTPAITPGDDVLASPDTITPLNRWDALQMVTPVPYTTLLPAPAAEALDGTYAKIDESPPQYWKCLRCADYRPVGGIWKLKIDRGIMRIYYDVTGWYSIASYTVSKDRLQVFNDPYCPYDVGQYKWKLKDGSLRLEPVDDASCAFGLRQQNLGNQPWLACSGTVRDQPPGCGTSKIPEAMTAENLSFTVKVIGGDSRFFDKPPDVYAVANRADREPPEGIHVSYHDEAVGYGLHRILWWNGDWIEVTTKHPFTSMGVQIMGEAQIGWARALFDGVEMWRGDTAAIWEKFGRHGGYIEVSDFKPGPHTIRVESLNFDYRPVTIAGFGFSYEGGVKNVEP